MQLPRRPQKKRAKANIDSVVEPLLQGAYLTLPYLTFPYGGSTRRQPPWVWAVIQAFARHTSHPAGVTSQRVNDTGAERLPSVRAHSTPGPPATSDCPSHRPSSILPARRETKRIDASLIICALLSDLAYSLCVI